MSATEPSIAANQLRSAQAAALADAGLERAIWALAHPGSAQGLADPLPALIPPPYDGSLLVPITAGGVERGGFRLTVAPGGGGNERDIVAVGWTPTDDPVDARAKAHHRLVATIMRIRAPADAAPCALCAVGDLQVAAGAAADARGDTTCGAKLGAWTSGTVVMGPGAEIWGADGNALSNQAGDIAQGQPSEGAEAWAFTNGELAALRRLAQSRGTYYRGSVAFDGASMPRDGLVFVDTVSGAPISAATPETDLARVVMGGGAGVFRGWMIVSGTLEISGDARLRGLAYALDGFAYRGASSSERAPDPRSASIARPLEAATASSHSAGCSSLGLTANCPIRANFPNGSGRPGIAPPFHCSVKPLTLSSAQHISYVIVRIFYG